MRGRIVGMSIMLLLAPALTGHPRLGVRGHGDGGRGGAESCADAHQPTKRQLTRSVTQILSDLAIEVPEGADIYALREIALKWESKFPEKIKSFTQKKRDQHRHPAASAEAEPGPGRLAVGGDRRQTTWQRCSSQCSTRTTTAKLSQQEISDSQRWQMGKMAGGGYGPRQFAHIDKNRDGFVDRPDADKFFAQMAAKHARER